MSSAAAGGAARPVRTFPDAQDYAFSLADQERYAKQRWHMPARLADGGLLAQLWREEGTRRGGGIVSSMLPVLALHTWPGARLGASWLKPAMRERAKGFAPPVSISMRRLARLSGVSLEGAAQAMASLERRGLLLREKVAASRHLGGPPRWQWALARTLYAQDGEAFVRIPGALVYGGLWMLMPTHATRHLYLTIAGLAPVRDEAAFLSAARRVVDERECGREEDDEWDEDDDPFVIDDARERAVQAALARARARLPLSVADLARHTGMGESAVESALLCLTRDMKVRAQGYRTEFVGPLVGSGLAGPNRVRWYAPSRKEAERCISPDVLNGGARVVAEKERKDTKGSKAAKPGAR